MIIELHDIDRFQYAEGVTVISVKFNRAVYMPHLKRTTFGFNLITDKQTSIRRPLHVDGWVSGNKEVLKAMQDAKWISNHKRYEELF